MPLTVVVIDSTQQTKTYQGNSWNDINDRNIEYAPFRYREISHNGWLQWCISQDELKPGNLYLSHYLPHPDQLTPDRALSFIDRTTLWMMENCKVVDLFVCSNKFCSKLSQRNRFEIFEKNKIL